MGSSGWMCVLRKLFICWNEIDKNVTIVRNFDLLKKEKRNWKLCVGGTCVMWMSFFENYKNLTVKFQQNWLHSL